MGRKNIGESEKYTLDVEISVLKELEEAVLEPTLRVKNVPQPTLRRIRGKVRDCCTKVIKKK